MRERNVLAAWALGLAILAPLRAGADNFVNARYDSRTDELVITMRYRGSNPDHGFSLTWGACQDADSGSGPKNLSASVLDDQWKDAARAPYQKTFRASLGDIPCRPAKVTLHTAPRYYMVVTVPGSRSP